MHVAAGALPATAAMDSVSVVSPIVRLPNLRHVIRNGLDRAARQWVWLVKPPKWREKQTRRTYRPCLSSLLPPARSVATTYFNYKPWAPEPRAASGRFSCRAQPFGCITLKCAASRHFFWEFAGLGRFAGERPTSGDWPLVWLSGDGSAKESLSTPLIST
jgi:hypothetical protein